MRVGWFGPIIGGIGLGMVSVVMSGLTYAPDWMTERVGVPTLIVGFGLFLVGFVHTAWALHVAYAEQDRLQRRLDGTFEAKMREFGKAVKVATEKMAEAYRGECDCDEECAAGCTEEAPEEVAP